MMPRNLNEIVAARFFYLLLLLLLFILIYPYLLSSRHGRIILSVFAASILVTAIYASSKTFHQRIIAISLATPIIILNIVYRLTGAEFLFYFFSADVVLFLSYTTTIILSYVLRRGPVTADKIEGAVCAYIVIAMLWAGLYHMINYFIPDSFASYGKPEGLSDFYDFLYFSFTTLTSTGYGDIVPVSPQARSLSIVEQLIGVFYTALLIARLAGLYPPSGMDARD
jgi:hypothetical protein